MLQFRPMAPLLYNVRADRQAGLRLPMAGFHNNDASCNLSQHLCVWYTEWRHRRTSIRGMYQQSYLLKGNERYDSTEGAKHMIVALYT